MDSSRPPGAPPYELRLSQGTIRYRDRGRGPVLLFLHGAMVNGALWRGVTARLEERYRCIAPDWPLGSHELPMDEDARLDFPRIAALVAEFMEGLGLDDVTLVGNDTGDALCAMVAAWHPQRVSRIVLTNGDTPGHFPPPMLWPWIGATYVPGFLGLASALLGLSPLRRGFYRIVARRPPGEAVRSSYLDRFRSDRGIRRDLYKVMRGIRARDLRAAEPGLYSFPGRILLLWAPEDRLFFPLDHAEALLPRLCRGALRTVPDAWSLVPEDQPERTAREIDAFLSERPAEAALPCGARPGDAAASR